MCLLLFTIDSKIIKKDRRKIRFAEEDMAKLIVMSLEDWSKADVDEIRGR